MNLTRAIGVVAVVLVGLLAFGAWAFAQSDGPGPPWGRGHWSDGERGWAGWHEGDRGPDPERVRELRDDLAADLAAELDAPAGEVEAALRAVVARRLDEAVAAGDIDRAQADDALAAYDDGDVRGLFRLFKR